ncbi:MAG: glycosyltransferase family 4 protein [Candidatus Omnitrophota bacterium]|nr:MAG: glycosyltransferase family 4 protein [Candidatus Omnitrophota bacterium]
MRVLLLTTHLNIGGVAVYTLNLARGLKKKNVSVWIASSGGDLVKTLEKDGIFHLPLGIKTKSEFNPKLIFAFFKLLIFIKKNNIDVIHAQTRVAQVLAYLSSRFSGASYVSTCHGFFKKSRIARKLFSAWGRHVIAISDAVVDHLVKDFNIKRKNVFLIYNGVDKEAFSQIVDKDEKGILKSNLGLAKSPVIGSISRLSPVKGLKYLLFAMKDILRDMPEVRLLLVGEGPSKEYLLGLAKKLGIENNVFFALNTTQTQRFLSIIDIFIFYSLQEGLGLSLLEALASGKPCVASNVGGVASIIEDGMTGILVPPKDTHALKDAIIKILKDKELSASLARKGNALIEEKFSLEKMVEGVVDVYKKACQK